MLRELSDTRQIAGEPLRRWFFSQEMDLVVWSENIEMIGFQLAYKNDGCEHSFSWRKGRGFNHYLVDDGEPFAGVNDTPLLCADGPFARDRVLQEFIAISHEIPPLIVEFIKNKIHEYQGPLIP